MNRQQWNTCRSTLFYFIDIDHMELFLLVVRKEYFGIFSKGFVVALKSFMTTS